MIESISYNECENESRRENCLCSITDAYIGKEMSGKHFKQLYPNVEFVKFTNKNEKHNDYQFLDGLNTDIHSFNHNILCSKGGFYFTGISDVYNPYLWVYYNNIIMYFMRKVTIPDDAIVYIEDFDKFKIDKFILGEKENIPMTMYTKCALHYYHKYPSLS